MRAKRSGKMLSAKWSTRFPGCRSSPDGRRAQRKDFSCVQVTEKAERVGGRCGRAAEDRRHPHLREAAGFGEEPERPQGSGTPDRDRGQKAAALRKSCG